VSADTSFDVKFNSRAVTEGPSRAAARAYLKGIGYTDDDLAKPIIGVASTWIETMPCNFHLRALAAAVKSGPSDILKVLGKAADDIVSSGDDVADADTRQRFTSMYDTKHSVTTEGNKKATLMLGPDDFPFPIPLVNTKTGWEFDIDEGRIEVLYRRIGAGTRNLVAACAERLTPPLLPGAGS